MRGPACWCGTRFGLTVLALIVVQYIYERGSKNGKRVQSNMGAKNHGVILPDANKEYTLNQLVGAAFGAAGQRCMALSTAVFVGCVCHAFEP